MIEKKALKEGQVLLLLQRNSGKSVKEVAQLLEIHPNHLSKIFKSEKLTAKIRNKYDSIPTQYVRALELGRDSAENLVVKLEQYVKTGKCPE